MTIPYGTICLWYGSIASIPASWKLCDGTNGTPDLRDRFLVGAGGIYAPGDTGGSTTHTHTIPADTATLEPGDTMIDSTPAGDLDTTTTSHNHFGATEDGPTEPPYYALAYIMKV